MTNGTLDRPTVSITDIEGVTREFEHIVGRSVGAFMAGTDLKEPVEGEVAYVDGMPIDITMPVEPWATVQIGGQPING